MLSVTINGYTKPCEANSGGISRVWVFDPADFDWTGSGASTYTAVALVAGATLIGGSGFFPIGFDYLEATYKASQSAKGSSNKWAHELMLQVPVLGSTLVEFIKHLQNALACSHLGFVIEYQNGNIAVIGESIVNAAPIPDFRMVMDGSETDAGKDFDDMNGAKLMFKGNYSRPAYYFTGGISAIIDLQGS